MSRFVIFSEHATVLLNGSLILQSVKVKHFAVVVFIYWIQISRDSSLWSLKIKVLDLNGSQTKSMFGEKG